jgi:pyrrolidone-carboxylate peptidase
LKECLERGDGPSPKRAPKLVLSLGSSGFSCGRIELETVAVNRIEGEDPDNSGRVFAPEPIAEAGPDEVRLPFDLDRMLTGVPAGDEEWVHLDDDMGTYVCNDLAYRTARYFARTSAYAGTEFAFLHIPADDCLDELKDPELWSPLIARMALAALGKKPKTALKVEFVMPPPPPPIHFTLPEIKLISTGVF